MLRMGIAWAREDLEIFDDAQEPLVWDEDQGLVRLQCESTKSDSEN